MKQQHLALSLVALAWASPALANSFTFDFSQPGSDPAASFEEDCLADDLDEAAEHACDARAAVMEAELLSHLIALEGDDDPESVALFQEILEIGAPALQTVAVQYFTRTEAPSDFLDSVKTFFFGSEPQLGATAAQLLGAGSNAEDAELGDLYTEQRNASDYDSLSYAEGDKYLAAACLKDARLNLMSSFTKGEQFTPAERLLMYDRFAFDFTDTTADYPVTAFVTDASLEEVTDHFTALFGADPYPPVGDSQAKLSALTAEMVTLQVDALNGDQAAIKKLQKLGEQMAELQVSVTVASRLQLTTIRAENDVFWIDGDPDDFTGPLPRTVTVGEDERLGRVVIRYLGGVVGGGTHDPDDGSPDGGSKPNDKPSDDDEDDDDAADDDDNPASSGGDSGCSVSASRHGSNGALALVLVAAVGVLRRRRVR